jgi:hypothetical protein
MKQEKNEDKLSKHRLELEELNKKYNHDELELTYHNVKETVINYFEKMTIEEQRTSLIKIIKDCQIFGEYIVIDTGKILFLFNINDNVCLPVETYEEFKNDKKFKDNFLHSSELLDEDGEITMAITRHFVKLFDNLDNDTQIENKTGVANLWDKIGSYFSVRRLGDIKIRSYNLEFNKISMKSIMKSKINNLGIKYDLTNTEKIVSFTSFLE